MSITYQPAQKVSQWTPRQKVTMAVTGPVVLFAFVIFGITAMAAGDPASTANLDVAGAAFVVGGIALVVFFWTLTGPWYKRWAQAARQSITPIPSPFEIADELRVQLGREPTIQEIESMHNMLVSHKREAQIHTAAGLGILWGLHHMAETAGGHGGLQDTQ